MANQIQIRRDTGANWIAANPVLAEGELGIETDAVPVQFKVGDGTTAWNSLGYVASGAMDVASSTLDDLVDGATYKRIVAAVATALNAGTYDAASCTAFGIGGDGAIITNLNNTTVNGLYKYASSITGAPTTNPGVAIYLGYDNLNWRAILALDVITKRLYLKSCSGDAISVASWYEIFNAYSDGNGGQPPAPKPRTGSADTDIGRARFIKTADNTALVLPAGGKWQVLYRGWEDVSTGITKLFTGDGETQVYAGGTLVLAAVSGQYSCGAIVRIE